MKEAYCNYEVSKLLKEKGFEQNNPYIEMYWRENGECSAIVGDEFYRIDSMYAAPTQQMAMAWLRKKGFYISPEHIGFCGNKPNDIPYYMWKPIVIQLPGNNIIYPQPLDAYRYYDTYEETVDGALKYTLENLI